MSHAELAISQASEGALPSSVTRADRAPVVSVLMAVHNGAATLTESLRSLTAQEFTDWELVIVDDGSSDDTARLLNEARRADARIVVLLNKERCGLPASLNRAAHEARGALFARLDADDVAYPTRFARQVAFLHEHPDIGVLGTGADLVDEMGRAISAVRPTEQHATLVRDRFRQTPVIHPSVMMRREVLESLGGYDTRLRRAQDHDLWLRAIRAGIHFQNLPDALIRYRVRTRPTVRSTAYVAFVILRGAKRDGVLLRHGWRAVMHFFLGFLVRSGLYRPRWLRER